MSISIALRNILFYILKRYELDNLPQPVFKIIYCPIYKKMCSHYLKSDTNIGIFIFQNEETIGIQAFNQLLSVLYSAVSDLEKVIILYNNCTSECRKVKVIPNTTIDLELHSITKLQINILKHDQYKINIKKINDVERDQIETYYGKKSLKTLKLSDPVSHYLKFSEGDIISYITDGIQDYRLVIQ